MTTPGPGPLNIHVKYWRNISITQIKSLSTLKSKQTANYLGQCFYANIQVKTLCSKRLRNAVFTLPLPCDFYIFFGTTLGSSYLLGLLHHHHHHHQLHHDHHEFRSWVCITPAQHISWAYPCGGRQMLFSFSSLFSTRAKMSLIRGSLVWQFGSIRARPD